MIPDGACDPRRAAHLAALAGIARGQRYEAEPLEEDRVRICGHGGRGVVVECRARDDDGGRLWFRPIGGAWIGEADNPADALVQVKQILHGDSS